MLRHQFGQHFVLRLDLLFQIRDSFLFRLMVGAASLLKGGGSVLEELLLPAVEYGWLKPRLVTQVRDRHSFQQMSPQNSDLLLRRVVLPSFLHVFAPLS